MLPLGKRDYYIYIYIPWKMEILSAWNKQHESWFMGFFRKCFFKASDGYLRNRGCLWWMRRGIGRHEELNKNRSCTCFEHYTCKSNFSPKVLQQLLLPTFHRLTYFKTSQSRVCFLSFTEAETVPPTGHPILPPSFSGPENTEELMRENCFIIQGNKLSQLSHLQSVKFTNLSTQQAKMDTAYM